LPSVVVEIPIECSMAA